MMVNNQVKLKKKMPCECFPQIVSPDLKPNEISSKIKKTKIQIFMFENL